MPRQGRADFSVPPASHSSRFPLFRPKHNQNKSPMERRVPSPQATTCLILRTAPERQIHPERDKTPQCPARNPRNSPRLAASSRQQVVPVVRDSAHLPPTAACSSETRRAIAPAHESPILVLCLPARRPRNQSAGRVLLHPNASGRRSVKRHHTSAASPRLHK